MKNFKIIEPILIYSTPCICWIIFVENGSKLAASYCLLFLSYEVFRRSSDLSWHTLEKKMFSSLTLRLINRDWLWSVEEGSGWELFNECNCTTLYYQWGSQTLRWRTLRRNFTYLGLYALRRSFFNADSTAEHYKMRTLRRMFSNKDSWGQLEAAYIWVN